MLLNRACSVQMQSPQIKSSFGISLSPIYRILMDFADCNSIVPTKNASRSFLGLCSCVRHLHHPLAVLPVKVESQGSHSMLIDMDLDLQYNVERQFTFDSDDEAGCNAEELMESERRRKIGTANKGKVPWNKGRPHTPETRARIKQRTIEAMRDPKVRSKMSEAPRMHSDQVKTKISFALRKLWGKRLQCKRAKEKLYMSWSENIAEFARKGGIDEEELRWDSYDILKREIDLQILEHATEKAKAKERKKIQAERKAQVKVKRAKLSQRLAKSEPEETPGKRPRKKHKVTKEVVVEELNLKARLTKIQRKKSVKNGQASSQIPAIVSCYPSLERLDLQLIEREKMRQKVSLADEIRAAKSRRNESVTTSFGLEE